MSAILKDPSQKPFEWLSDASPDQQFVVISKSLPSPTQLSPQGPIFSSSSSLSLEWASVAQAEAYKISWKLPNDSEFKSVLIQNTKYELNFSTYEKLSSTTLLKWQVSAATHLDIQGNPQAFSQPSFATVQIQPKPKIAFHQLELGLKTSILPLNYSVLSYSQGYKGATSTFGQSFEFSTSYAFLPNTLIKANWNFQTFPIDQRDQYLSDVNLIAQQKISSGLKFNRFFIAPSLGFESLQINEVVASQIQSTPFRMRTWGFHLGLDTHIPVFSHLSLAFNAGLHLPVAASNMPSYSKFTSDRSFQSFFVGGQVNFDWTPQLSLFLSAQYNQKSLSLTSTLAPSFGDIISVNFFTFSTGISLHLFSNVSE